MRKSVFGLGVVGALGLLAVTALTLASVEQLRGEQAPDFELKTLDGQTVKLSDQQGKVVLLDFWATWCPPCRKGLPHVQEWASNEELTKQGLVVWAVNAREKPEKIKDFMEKNKFTFTVPMDATGEVMNDYDIEGIPTQIVIGVDGVVKHVQVGLGNKEQIEKVIKDELAKVKKSA